MSGAIVLLAGLAGVAGVALAAVASHAGGGNLQTAATMLLVHAPALLAIGLREAGSRLLLSAAIALGLGLLLFCGDLAARHYLGGRLFPMAAPAGGMFLIAGWLLVAVFGIWR